MAGPHVAGLVALLIDAQPDLAGNVDLLEQLIQDTAVSLYTEEGCGGDSPQSIPNNTYGWGRIDAYAAYESAATLPTPSPTPTTTPGPTSTPEATATIGSPTVELFIPTWFGP